MWIFLPLYVLLVFLCCIFLFSWKRIYMSEIGKELATTRLKAGAVVMVAVKGTSDNLPLFLYSFYSSYLSLFIFVRTGSIDICTYHLKKYAYALLKTFVHFTLSDWYCEQKICNHDAGGKHTFSSYSFDSLAVFVRTLDSECGRKF